MAMYNVTVRVQLKQKLKPQRLILKKDNYWYSEVKV
jgi:hypothetical protein